MKAEGLINHLLERGVNVEGKALKKAVNAAYKLQHVMYSVDENDREAYDRIRSLIKRKDASNASNASSSEVTWSFTIVFTLMLDLPCIR